MMLTVNVQDINGKKISKNFNLSLPAIVKHLAFSGCHFMQPRFKILRCIGMLFHYTFYLQKLDRNKFSLPPKQIYDPTEKGQFSNLAGKAIADYLSEKIDNSMFSVSYEAAMKMSNQPIAREERPDLLAFSKTNMFAIEAKGYCSNINNMNCYTNKFKGCKFDINFCVASVSYNMYNKIECNYCKSQLNNTYTNAIKRREILQRFSKNYYLKFSDFIDGTESSIETFSNERFYIIDLQKYYLDSIESPLKIWMAKLFDIYKLKLIITEKVKEYAKNGLADLRPFEFEGDDSIYISNDRIGLKIEQLDKMYK